MIIGIVVALPEETGTLTPRQMPVGSLTSLSSTILINCSGVGPDNARKAAKNLIAHGATHLLSWGCAGALNDALRPGDLIVTNTLIDAELMRIEFSPGRLDQVLNLLRQYLPVRSGILAETANLIETSEDKRYLHVQTNADILDMESVAIAKVAKNYDLPFMAIRAVADPVNMDLPKAIKRAMNPQGDVSIRKLVWFLLFHPLDLPGLIKLGGNFNKAKKQLKSAAEHLDAIAGLE